jgi:hypothetical protein
MVLSVLNATEVTRVGRVCQDAINALVHARLAMEIQKDAFLACQATISATRIVSNA